MHYFDYESNGKYVDMGKMETSISGLIITKELSIELILKNKKTREGY